MATTSSSSPICCLVPAGARRLNVRDVLFFDKKPASETPWTKKLWIYDLRTNKHFTLKTNPLKRDDLDEFALLYNPANRYDRKATWSAETPEGRWRAYEDDELIARDNASLDIFWLKDESLADSDNLPPPEVIAQGNRRRSGSRAGAVQVDCRGSRRSIDRGDHLMGT